MKGKYIKIALLSLGFIGLVSSCGEDFLNKEPKDLVGEETLKKEISKNPELLGSQISGVYSYLFKAGQFTVAPLHFDFAQKTFDILTDLMSGDMSMISNFHNHFREGSELTANESYTLYAYGIWRVNYKIISEANGLLEVIGSDTQIPENDKLKIYYAQLKFIRAYAYLNIANSYVGRYEENKDKKVLPLYNLTSGYKDIKEFSTLSEIYDQIISDLKQAQEILQNYQRPDKLSADASTATAYLAYAYLNKGDYQNAYDEAIKYVDNANYPILKLAELTTTGFNDITHPDLLWGVDINQETTGHLLTFWGHMDVFTLSYAYVSMGKLINNHLMAEMPTYDLRKKWFDSGNISYIPDGKTELKNLREGYPVNKFYSKLGRSNYDNMAPEEKRLGTDLEWLSDIHFLRTEEFYLIAAEAAARKGDDAKSKEILIKLLKERTEESKIAEMEGVVNAYDNDKLLEAIRYNWRVEMWGEGKGLQTLLRFKATNKFASTSFANADKDIKYDDKRLIFEIPEREKNNNKYAPINN